MAELQRPANTAGEEERGVVRVKVKKCDGILPVEFRSFAVDPQITSLEVLQHILIRAFELNGKRNFVISYLSRDRSGAEMYLTLVSDWDLDVAFISSARPYLQLKMDIKPSEDSPVLEEWDIISPKDVIGSEQLFADRTRSLASAALPFTQTLLSQVGRTLSKVQQAFGWSYGEEIKPFKPPLSDAEFHSYLNGQGQLSRPEELRLRIYHGGVEPSLRKVVWRYLLNVYPDGLTGQERMDYMKRKTREYDQLKGEWTARVSTEDLEFIRGNVLKDVLRTDRAHPYYAGSEDSPHLTALTDLLTTFAITHPQISYCQGMSDIASPILAVMDNEAHAFICFCGIMKRLEGNFRPDGQLMSVKFQHLKLLLQYSDPEFHSYLVSRGADDLFFCYRWLLLELKREFVFDDALRMLEITWSSLPPDPPETEVELLGPALEVDDAMCSKEKKDKLDNGFGDDGDDDDDEQKEKQRRRHMLRPSREKMEVNRSAVPEGKQRQSLCPKKRNEGSEASSSSWPGVSPDSSPKSTSLSTPNGAIPTTEPSALVPSVQVHSHTGIHTPTICTAKTTIVSPSHSQNRSLLSSPILSFGKSSSLSGSKSSSNTLPSPGNKSPSSPTSARAETTSIKPCSLPPPQEFGKGNPFMLFLCLSILLEHRDHIIKNSLDYNELAMHFDRLVRRHNLSRVLQRAKALFADYLQSEVWDSEEGDEVSLDSPMTATAARLSPSSAISARPIYSPLGSPPSSPPNSTYNLATTIPSPTAHLSLSPS
uniref:Rab-GAP TBC domain-containing protein n=1 Tax=Gouania willdenowi TaxID=441366 RepID=A0A8C5HBD8_GOUWI